jgi:hypothetical protein
MKKFLSVCAAMLLFLGWASIGSAQESEDLAFGTLGPIGTDVYTLICAPVAGVTVAAEANLADTGGVDGIRLALALLDPHGFGIGRVAPDGAGSTGAQTLTRGPGAYVVSISRSFAFTVESYNAFIRCKNASTGATTAHAHFLNQNQ